MPEFVWKGDWQRFAAALPRVEMLWGKMLPAHGCTLIHGPGGCGKSALVWGLMNAMDLGEHYLGFNVTKANCLLISFDMSKFAHNERWGQKFLPAFNICYESKLDASTPKFCKMPIYKEVQQVVAQYDIRLVVIDALSGLTLGHKMTDDDVATAVMANLEAWLPATAKLVIHHDRKTPYGSDGVPHPATGEDFLGSVMWRNNAVSQIHMWKTNECMSTLAHEKSQVSALYEDQLKLYIDMHGEAELWDQKRADDVIKKLHDAIEDLGLQDASATRQTELVARHYGVAPSTVWRWKKLAKEAK